MIPVLLGMDASPTHLGWGAVDDERGRPIMADVLDLNGSAESTRDAVRAVASFLAIRELEPILAYIEEPFGTQGRWLFNSGVAIGYLEMALRGTWPHIVLPRILPKTWRAHLGMAQPPKGTTTGARRAWNKLQSVYLAQELGFELPVVGKRVRRPSDDAAEGALLARCAWVDAEAGRIERLGAAA